MPRRRLLVSLLVVLPPALAGCGEATIDEVADGEAAYSVEVGDEPIRGGGD